MQTIQSDVLKIEIDEKGAELKSVFHSQLEYMWSGDPAWWGKTSPVLFPIVGALKDGCYRHGGKTYQLPRHGFAREKPFAVTEQTNDSIAFVLQSDEETAKVYPFHFLFAIRYTVEGSRLTTTYEVQNRGDEEMLFSVGGHPAFKLPLAEGTAYDDYTLRFEKAETAPRWPISRDGLIETTPQPLLENATALPLSKDLFKKDAVVFKGLKSAYVDLVSSKTPHGLRFSLEGFPYLGLWAAPGADFLCIEPWCGIADSVEASGELREKEGIVSLPEGEKFAVSWSVQFY